MRKQNVKFDVIEKNDETIGSISYGCSRFIESQRLHKDFHNANLMISVKYVVCKDLKSSQSEYHKVGSRKKKLLTKN